MTSAAYGVGRDSIAEVTAVDCPVSPFFATAAWLGVLPGEERAHPARPGSRFGRSRGCASALASTSGDQKGAFLFLVAAELSRRIPRRLGKLMFADGTSQADRRCRALGSSEIDLNLGVGKLELSYQIGFSQSCPTRFPTIPMPGTHRPV